MLTAEILIVALNSILFQRQLYPAKHFAKSRKWGVPVLMCSIPEVQQYMKSVVSSIKINWLETREPASLQLVALTILDSKTNPIEVWKFDLRELQDESRITPEQQRASIQALFREMSCIAVVMPVLDDELTFKISIEDQPMHNIPKGWVPSQHVHIKHGMKANFQTIEVDKCVIAPQIVYQRASLTN